MPYKPELLVRDLTLYNGYYCGLCQSLQRDYGVTSRALLNYDCTFVAALLDSVGERKPCVLKRCPFKPLAKKRTFAQPSEGLRFAAALNVLLSYYKFGDDWLDDRSVSALTMRIAFKRAKRKAERLFPELDSAICLGMNRLNALEASDCDSIDMVANAFGELLAEAIDAAPVNDDRTKKALYSLSRNMGRWIYLIDAWHDRERDKKHNDYNVFNINNTEAERAQMLLEVALNQAMRAYDLIDIQSNRGLLDNVMYMGCFEKTQAVLKAHNETAAHENK